jgi:hypothetical protein
MSEKIAVLGINPGTKSTAWVVFRGTELRDWGVKTLKGRWSPQKITVLVRFLLELSARYRISRLALKTLSPGQTSRNLTRLTAAIVRRFAKRGIRIESYSLDDLKGFFSPHAPKINRKKLSELVAQEYPPLYSLLAKEKKNRNSYYQKLFEAVALGSLATRAV